MSGSDTISPTAHYTGYVWARNGLSHPALTTNEGRLLFASLEPAMLTSRALGGPSLERYLLARHRAIDARLAAGIDSGEISQVIEVAAGLSPRGWRFAQRYGDRITYIEADLPAMAARKRRALERMNSLGAHHRLRDIDALTDEGPLSLAALAAEMDADRGLAIITEGLLGYVSPEDLKALWRRFATVLSGFAAGRYLSDLHLGSALTLEVRVFRLLLAGFVRGGVYLHFDDAEQAEQRLREAGFATATVIPADQVIAEDGERPHGSGTQMAHILEASTE